MRGGGGWVEEVKSHTNQESYHRHFDTIYTVSQAFLKVIKESEWGRGEAKVALPLKTL